jgi:hypothetical protein
MKGMNLWYPGGVLLLFGALTRLLDIDNDLPSWTVFGFGISQLSESEKKANESVSKPKIRDVRGGHRHLVSKVLNKRTAYSVAALLTISGDPLKPNTKTVSPD